MFKENDIVMFIKKEPFNLYERTPEELESIFLFGIVSHDSIGKETKVVSGEAASGKIID